MNKKILLFGIVLLLLSSFVSAIDTSNLISYYSYDNNANDDYSSNDGTLIGSPIHANAVLGKGYYFNGVDQAISFGTDTFKLDVQTNFTLCSWINTTTFTVVEDDLLDFGLNFRLTMKNNGWQGYIYDGVTANRAASSTNATTNTFHFACLTSDGTNERLFVNGENIATVSSGYPTTYTGGREFGVWQSYVGGVTTIPGSVDETSVWSKILTQGEILELYNNGNGFNPISINDTRYESAYQITQDDLITITSDDTWTTIIQGDFALEENNTNYGSTTVQVLSQTIDTEFECRTLIDGNETGDNVNRTNIAGEIGSLTVLRPDVEIAGVYNVEVQCMKNGGNTLINYTNGIGHVFNTDEIDSFDFNETFSFNGTNIDLSSTIINSSYDGYIVFESSGTISSQQGGLLELQFYTNDSQSCGVNRRYINAGTNGAIGGVCAIKVQEGVPINITLNGTSINQTTVTGISHAKILSYANSTALYEVSVTETPTLIGSVLVNNTDRLDKVFMKANIPISDSSQTINLQFALNGTLVSQAVPYTAGSNIKQSIQQYLADSINSDFINVSLYATSQTPPITPIIIKGGNLLSYVTNEYNLNLTGFTLTLQDQNTTESIQVFNATIDDTLYQIEDGSTLVFCDGLVNITINAEDKFPRTILNHDCSNNLLAEVPSIYNYVYYENLALASPVVNSKVEIVFPSGYTKEYTTDLNGMINFSTLQNEVYESGLFKFTLEGSQGFITPFVSNETLTVDNMIINKTYEITPANLIVNLFYRDTGLPFMDNVNVILIGETNQTTDTGQVIFQNQTFTSREYQILAVADGYGTEQINFDYTNQENLTLNIFLLNVTGDDTGTLFVNTVDEWGFKVQGVDLKLYEFDIETQSFISSAETTTNTNAEGTFLIELGKKQYIITGTTTINGLNYEASTADAVPGGTIYTVDNDVIDLVLRTVVEPIIPISDFLVVNVNEDLLPGNISNIMVDYYTTDNVVTEVCIEYFLINYTQRISKSLTCVEASSAIMTQNVFYGLNRSNTYVAEVYNLHNGAKTSIESYPYPSIFSIETQLDNYSWVGSLILIIWLGIIALGYWSKNIGGIICIFGSMFAVIEYLVFTSYSDPIIGAFKIVVLFLIYLKAKRKQDLG